MKKIFKWIFNMTEKRCCGRCYSPYPDISLCNHCLTELSNTIKRLDTQETENSHRKWVSVHDDLPPEGQQVEIILKHYYRGTRYISTSSFNRERGWQVDTYVLYWRKIDEETLNLLKSKDDENNNSGEADTKGTS